MKNNTFIKICFLLSLLITAHDQLLIAEVRFPSDWTFFDTPQRTRTSIGVTEGTPIEVLVTIRLNNQSSKEVTVLLGGSLPSSVTLSPGTFKDILHSTFTLNSAGEKIMNSFKGIKIYLSLPGQSGSTSAATEPLPDFDTNAHGEINGEIKWHYSQSFQGGTFDDSKSTMAELLIENYK